MRNKASMSSKTRPKTTPSRNADASSLSQESVVATEPFNPIPSPPYEAATAEEKKQWGGFCEVESEPALFNVMMREMGVQGIKIHEIISFDEEVLAFLPQPIHGIILLLQYMPDPTSEPQDSCPENVWFANQTHGNVCSTLGLLNVIMNVKGLVLGDALTSFKEFTANFAPAERGQAVGNFEFIRAIHNSFARKMDMLVGDLSLSNDHEDSMQRPKKKARAVSRRKKPKASSKEFSDQAFHFIAYVPIDDDVWMLDGLDRQPTHAGEIDSNRGWMETVRPSIEARMASYGDNQINFTCLAVCHDRMLENKAALASCIRGLQAIDETLGQPDDNVKAVKADDLSEQEACHQLDPGAIDVAKLPESVVEHLKEGDAAKLRQLRAELEQNKSYLSADVQEHIMSARDDQRRADDQRLDFTPLIHTWLRMLADNGTLQEMIAEDKQK